MSPPDQVAMVVDPVEKAVKQLTDNGTGLAGSWTGKQAEYNASGGHDSRSYEAEYDDNATDALLDAFHSTYTTYSLNTMYAAGQLPDQFSGLAGKGREVLWNYLGADGAAAQALAAALGPAPR